MFRFTAFCLFFLILLFVAPQIWSYLTYQPPAANWWNASHAETGLAPDPDDTTEAVVQVYAAPAFGWRGAFAEHTWLALKDAEAGHYDRYEVIGWGVGGRCFRRAPQSGQSGQRVVRFAAPPRARPSR